MIKDYLKNLGLERHSDNDVSVLSLTYKYVAAVLHTANQLNKLQIEDLTFAFMIFLRLCMFI